MFLFCWFRVYLPPFSSIDARLMATHLVVFLTLLYGCLGGWASNVLVKADCFSWAAGF